MGNSLTPHNATEDATLSEHAIIAWSTVFAFVAVVIVAGNSLTIAAFTTKRLVRRRAHFFLISLAVADIMVGALVIPLYIYLSVTHQEGAVNHVFEAVDILCGLVSVSTLALISVERLFAIGWPFLHRLLQRRVYFSLIGFAWISACTLSVINLLHRYKIVPNFATLDIVLAVLLTSFVVICISYTSLWVKVHFRVSHGIGREQDKKLAKTLSLVTGVFVFTWLPFQSLLYVVYFCKVCPMPSQNVLNFIKLLQYCNSFMNPIIYALRMPEFRKTTEEILNWRCHEAEEEIPLETLRGGTLGSVKGILGSYSSLNIRLCMGMQNIMSSELNSSSCRRKSFGKNNTRRKSTRRSSRRALTNVSVV